MTSDTEERWELDTERPVRDLIRRNRLPVIGIGLLGSGIGLIEAFLLVLVVRIASVVAGEVVDVGAVDFGLIELDRISTSQGFLIGGIGVVLLLALQVTAAATEAQVARREVVEARDRTVSSFLGADWHTQSSVPDGEFITTVTAYADRVQSSLSYAMLAVAAGSSFMAMLLVAIIVDPPAAAAIALAGGGFGLLMRPLTRFSRRYSERMSTATKQHTAEISRMLRVRRDIAAFDVATPMAARLLHLSGEQARWTAWTRFTVRMVPNLYRTIVIAVLFLGLGGVRALGVTNIPSIAAIVLILLRALNYTQTVQSMVQSLAETTPPLRMLAEEINRFDAAEVVRRGEPLERVDTIELVGVGFRYDDGDPVLADLDLTLRRGEVVGVIGPSGAGKSTLVDVLMGLRAPITGQVLINGAPLSTLDVLSLRTLTALVPQEPQMLRGSVRDNVVFMRDGLTDEAVLGALEQAQLGVLVGERGLDSEVGEHGGSLSGGQRQRLGIARALAGSPDVVILDEPTSALDVDAERQVVGVLEQLQGDRITIVISHRPAALEVCDQVLVLSNQATYHVVDRRSIDDIDAFLSAAVKAPEDESSDAPAAVVEPVEDLVAERRDEGAA